MVESLPYCVSSKLHRKVAWLQLLRPFGREALEVLLRSPVLAVIWPANRRGSFAQFTYSRRWLNGEAKRVFPPYFGYVVNGKKDEAVVGSNVRGEKSR